jgi:hypothetical protein
LQRSTAYWPKAPTRLGSSALELRRVVAIWQARDRPVLGCGSIRKVKKSFVDVAPTPLFGRIVAFDDRVRSGAKMLGGMPVGRVIATADMTAGPADTQVNPGRTALQALLAALRARCYVTNRIKMGAGLGHDPSLSLLDLESSAAGDASESIFQIPMRPVPLGVVLQFS